MIIQSRRKLWTLFATTTLLSVMCLIPTIETVTTPPVKNVTEMEIIIELIKIGSLDEANQRFEDTYTHSDLIGGENFVCVTIIERAYDEKLENFDKVITFIGERSTSVKMSAYPALYNEMEKSNHSSSSENLVLNCLMKEYGISNFTENSQSINQVITQWADDIKTGNYDKIRSFFTTYANKCKPLIKYLEPLIRTVYTSSGENITSRFATEYFDQILKFIEVLPHPSIKIDGYFAARNGLQSFSLEHSKEMLKLVYEVKKLSDWGWGIDLLNSLPKTFRQILDRKTCYIKNTHFGEYLYASSVKSTSDKNIYSKVNGPSYIKRPAYAKSSYIKSPRIGDCDVYTWIPKERVVEGRWKFVGTRKKGNQIYFYIFSHHWWNRWNAYLCSYSMSTTEKLLSEENQVKRCNYFAPLSALLWKLEPVVENGQHVFKILRKRDEDSEGSDELTLVAGGNGFRRDTDRRKVFTWKTGNGQVEGEWEILCDN